MTPLNIVVVQPVRQGGETLRRGPVGPDVGPLPQQGLDEAFRLAVRPGRVGSRAEMSHAGTGPALREDVGPIPRAIVGQDPAHPDSQAAVPRERPPEKRGDGHALLIGQDLDVGQPRGVIDRHMDVLPADAPDLAPSIAGDAMADAADPPEFLDVQVHQAAGPGVLVALDGHDGLEGAEPTQPMVLEDPGDGGATEPQGAGDLGPGPALAAQPEDPRDELGGRRRRLPPRPARAVLQTRPAFGPVALDPLADGPLTHPEGLRHVPPGFGAAGHAVDQGLSTARGGPGMLMDVHPSLRPGMVGCFATTSLPDEARVNNLLRLHT